jgi:hypothetical protein
MKRLKKSKKILRNIKAENLQVLSNVKNLVYFNNSRSSIKNFELKRNQLILIRCQIELGGNCGQGLIAMSESTRRHSRER